MNLSNGKKRVQGETGGGLVYKKGIACGRLGVGGFTRKGSIGCRLGDGMV